MTWRPDGPVGYEQRKTRWRAIPYLRGTGLDLGCGPEKVLDTQHVIGVDSNRDAELFGIQANPNVYGDVTELTMFSAGSMDFVFSSHTLEHIDWEKVPATLRSWCRVIRKGGYLTLYLPLSGLYPDPGEPGANLDHRWAVTYEKVVEAMEKVPQDWDLCHYEKCDKGEEYSGFWSFKIL